MKRYSVYQNGFAYSDPTGPYFKVEDVIPLLGEIQVLKNSLKQMEEASTRTVEKPSNASEDELCQLFLRLQQQTQIKYKLLGILKGIEEDESTPPGIKVAIHDSLLKIGIRHDKEK